jgi:hypothetical protein
MGFVRKAVIGLQVFNVKSIHGAEPMIRIPDTEVTDAEWKRWADSDGQALIQLGIPERVVNNRFVWGDFLCRGRLEQHPKLEDFDVDQLPMESKRPLLDILMASYQLPEIGEFDLVDVLWRQLNNEPLWEYFERL